MDRPPSAPVFPKHQGVRRSGRSGGYVAILAVVIVAAIGTVIAITLLLGGLNAGKNSGAVVQSAQARGVANACAELAVQKLVTSAVFVGIVNVTLGQGSCTYNITSTSATTSLVSVTGTVGTVVRKVQLVATILPLLSITQWQEVP